jgi:hypothetical protein
MTPNVQVGTILIEDRPLVTRILDLGSESYSAKWVVLKVLDQKLRSVGWNRSFMAEEAEATVFGSLAAKNIQKALKRIFLKMRKQNFNCLEVTKMRTAFLVCRTSRFAHTLITFSFWAVRRKAAY